jgi:hypothetical protein
MGMPDGSLVGVNIGVLLGRELGSVVGRDDRVASDGTNHDSRYQCWRSSSMAGCKKEND